MSDSSDDIEDARIQSLQSALDGAINDLRKIWHHCDCTEKCECSDDIKEFAVIAIKKLKESRGEK
jgi:hypothetical protein